ncbi:hypothetical protein AHAS_Ahas14G0262800 [Arachis hypogaea]
MVALEASKIQQEIGFCTPRRLPLHLVSNQIIDMKKYGVADWAKRGTQDFILCSWMLFNTLPILLVTMPSMQRSFIRFIVCSTALESGRNG